MKFWDDAAAADMIPNLWFYQLVNVFFFFFFCLRFWNSLFSRPKYLSGFSSSSSSSSLVWDGLIKWNVVLLPRSAIFLQNWQNVKKASPFIKCANGFSDSECPKNARGLLISGRREREGVLGEGVHLNGHLFFFQEFPQFLVKVLPIKSAFVSRVHYQNGWQIRGGNETATYPHIEKLEVDERFDKRSLGQN